MAVDAGGPWSWRWASPYGGGGCESGCWWWRVCEWLLMLEVGGAGGGRVRMVVEGE